MDNGNLSFEINQPPTQLAFVEQPNEVTFKKPLIRRQQSFQPENRNTARVHSYNRRYRSKIVVQKPVGMPLCEVGFSMNVDLASENRLLRSRLEEYQLRIARLQTQKAQMRRQFVLETEELALKMKTLKNYSEDAIKSLCLNQSDHLRNSLKLILQGKESHSNELVIKRFQDLLRGLRKSQHFAESVQKLGSRIQGKPLSLKEAWRWVKGLVGQQLRQGEPEL